MKLRSYISIITFLLFISGTALYSQNCKKFHLYGECFQYPGLNYKIEGQSRSNVIGLGDKLMYNVIFYGERNYKLYFCASNVFNPVHFTLTDDLSKKKIFDNKDNEYSGTVELNIENTRRIIIEITVMAFDADPATTENYFGCLGFLMFWKPEGK